MARRPANEYEPHKQEPELSSSSATPLQTGFRLMFMPVFAARAMMLLPSSVFLKERQPSSSQQQHRQAGLLQRLREGCGLSMNSDLSLVLPRILYCCQDWGLLWHALAYNAVGGLVRILAAEGVIQMLKRCLEGAANRLLEPRASAGYPRMQLSLVNLPLASFNPPRVYYASDFPWTEAAGWPQDGLERRICLAHFMSLCARLGYESCSVIHRVVDVLWGGEVIGCVRSAATSPVSWYAFANCEAVVLTFTGSSALHLLSWSAEAPISLNQRAGMGAVSDAVCNALFNLPQDAEECVFDAALAAIAHLAASRSLFIVGHGSGGALACVFALALKLKRTHLSQQAGPSCCQCRAGPSCKCRTGCPGVEGVYTFGQPCVGDAGFAERLRASYSGRLFCYQLQADVATLLPPSHAFAATAKPAGQGARSSRNAVQVLQAPQPSSWGQWLVQAALCAVPGILYHLPWQYELALRQQMRSVPAMQAAQEHEQDGDGVSMASQEAEEAEDGSPTDVSTGHDVANELASMGFEVRGRKLQHGSPGSFHEGLRGRASQLSRQLSPVPTQSPSPTGSMLSALSELRRGGPMELPSKKAVEASQMLRTRFESAGWSIGSARPAEGHPEPAHSTLTAPGTQFWSVIDGDHARMPSAHRENATEGLARPASRGSEGRAGVWGSPVGLMPMSPDSASGLLGGQDATPPALQAPLAQLHSEASIQSADGPVVAPDTLRGAISLPRHPPALAESEPVPVPVPAPAPPLSLHMVKSSSAVSPSPSASHRSSSQHSQRAGPSTARAGPRRAASGREGGQRDSFLTLQDFSINGGSTRAYDDRAGAAAAVPGPKQEIFWPEPI